MASGAGSGGRAGTMKRPPSAWARQRNTRRCQPASNSEGAAVSVDQLEASGASATSCPARTELPTQPSHTRAKAGATLHLDLPWVRVHDLKHTFGRRLRAAGVSFEDRRDLLGHRSGRITTHYSAAELGRLIEAAETIAGQNERRPELVVLRGKLGTESRKTPARIPAG